MARRKTTSTKFSTAKSLTTSLKTMLKTAGLLSLSSLFSVAFSVAQAQENKTEITFHKDIEPILQRSCQNCHRPGGVAPMSLVSYEEVAPFAGLIEYKTGLRDRAGAMPPWYMEKNIGIQDYKNDPSLTDAEIEAISVWAAQAHREAIVPMPLKP